MKTREHHDPTPYLHLLICPRCQEMLGSEGSKLFCRGCSHRFPVQDGIPLLHWPDDSDLPPNHVTEIIRSFYERNPFPDYEDTDNLGRLMDKAREGIFARLLDEQIAFGVRVLDCGCGTGQLANFLGIAHRTVFGTDICLNSLGLAQKFKEKEGMHRVHFLQMNLFRPVFPPGTFDTVICNGVLHHTSDPQKGFQRLAALVKPKGHLIVGLYHRYGRMATDLRRVLFRVSGNRFTFLDPRLRRGKLGKLRHSAWFADQYANPHELKHTIGGVFKWLEPSGLELIKTIPKTRFGIPFSLDEKLFQQELPGSSLQRVLIETAMLFTGAQEGGFFTVIARKKP
ncbi:class I SAM-dependent methyltransferase [Acidobacteria bacterium AH-259-D05]|nr:class I SAM-dependent methyltransferase [Acidobacteria bacterium AH-259-D05]